MKLKFILLGLVAGLALMVAANPDSDTDAVADFDRVNDFDEYDGDEAGGLVARGINPISGLPVPKVKGHKHKHHKHKKHHKGHKGKKKHHGGLPYRTQHECPGDLCGVPVPWELKWKSKHYKGNIH